MEEKKFEKLINDLKNLSKIEAPDNFEFLLQNKINNFIEKEFPETRRNFNLIPIFAFTSIIVILFLIFQPSDEYVDPLQIEPQMREDLIVYDEDLSISAFSEIINDSFIESDTSPQNFKNNQESYTNKIIETENNVSNIKNITISKEELNFVKPLLSEEEIKKVQALKKKILSDMN